MSGAVVALARVYRKTGRARDAVNILVDFLASDPADFEALMGLAQALLDAGRLEQAREAFERLVALDPDHVGTHFYLGVTLARLRCYPEAVRAWERVAQLEPAGALAQRARQHARTALDLQHIFQTEGVEAA